ncbi:MAG: cyclic nucleotide-binding domain-containing protein [Acidimicrobiales bacterium]
MAKSLLEMGARGRHHGRGRGMGDGSGGQTRPPDPTLLRPDSIWSKLALHRVPQGYLLVAAFVSYMILALSDLQGVPTWLGFGLALFPWAVIVLIEVEWAYEHFHWLALFFLMAFVQTIHYSEHCIEIIQYHVFHDSLLQSIAIFSTLNIEWVHFLGDSFLLVGTLVLLSKFPRNPWLWPAGFFGTLHTAEHVFLIVNHVFEHVPGGASGLLASPGGYILGGVGLVRPDLHWIYNTLYTIPFVAALVYQLRHSYDVALDKALEGAPKEELTRAARRLETIHYPAGISVLAPGDDTDRLYIVTEGEAGVYAHNEAGQEEEVATIRKGGYFGEVGLLVPGAPHRKVVRAKTALSVLAMDETTFRHLMAASQITQQRLTATAKDRVAAMS